MLVIRISYLAGIACMGSGSLALSFAFIYLFDFLLQQMQDTLKKAWDADGSPFKGTEYDPSLVNMSGGNNS